MTAESSTIHVLVRRERDWYVAQFLEFDFATQAKSLTRLKREVELALRFQIEESERTGRDLFHGYSRAPEKFWQMYAEAKELSFRQVRRHASRSIPRRIELRAVANSGWRQAAMYQ
jgi:hypothetical protein